MQNQDTQNEDQITTVNTASPEETSLQNESEALNAVEPAAGDAPAQASQTQDTSNEGIPLNSANFQSQISDLAQTISIETRGILDETEIEYSIITATTQNNDTQIALRQSAATIQPQITIQTAVAPLETTAPTQQAATIETSIKLSNATTNGNIINDTDHFEISAQTNNKTVKLFGDDIGIQNVSNTAQVSLTVKTEDTLRATLKSGWNSIKNISVESESIDTAILKNFVHADISLYGGDSKTIKVLDAKRGTIETDTGDDTIIVKALTNGAGWSNTFDIDSGAGDDKIRATGDDGHTIFEISAESQHDTVRIRGEYDHAEINLGSGDDTARGGDSNDIIIGGEGDDALFGGNDTDIALFMGSIDQYIITKRGGKYQIEDTIEGRDGTDTIKGIEGLIFGLEALTENATTTQEQAQDNALDLSALIDNNDPLQNAIDTFIYNADQGLATNAAIQSNVPTLTIFTIQDAIIETHPAIV